MPESWSLDSIPAAPWYAFTLRCGACHRVAARWVVADDAKTVAEIQSGQWYSANVSANRGGVRNPCTCSWPAEYPSPQARDFRKAATRGPKGERGSVTIIAAP